MKIPNHVAIILDGNGTLGKSKRHADATYGHTVGCEECRNGLSG